MSRAFVLWSSRDPARDFWPLFAPPQCLPLDSKTARPLHLLQWLALVTFQNMEKQMIEVKLGDLSDEQLDLVAGGSHRQGNITADSKADGNPQVDLYMYNSYTNETLAENVSGRYRAGRGTSQ
jgi:hypothetical protein